MHLCVLGRKLAKMALLSWPVGMAGSRRGQRDGGLLLWHWNGYLGRGCALLKGVEWNRQVVGKKRRWNLTVQGL